jgi:ferritin
VQARRWNQRRKMVAWAPANRRYRRGNSPSGTLEKRYLMVTLQDWQRLITGDAADPSRFASPASDEETNPMISNGMAARISAQINRELYSAYFYLGLSAQAETMNLKGTAAWFMAKHNEEMTHAMKMYRYLIDQDAPIALTQIAAPPAETDGVLRMFERTLSHEREVTAAINDLVDHALSEKDHATNIFLQWFVTEQIEEEATVNDILGRLRLFGDQGQGLLMIDNELAAVAKQMGQAAATRSSVAM